MSKPTTHKTECWYCGAEFMSQGLDDNYCCEECLELASDDDTGFSMDAETREREEAYAPLQF